MLVDNLSRPGQMDEHITAPTNGTNNQCNTHLLLVCGELRVALADAGLERLRADAAVSLVGGGQRVVARPEPAGELGTVCVCERVCVCVCKYVR